jgi:hypothetical protein
VLYREREGYDFDFFNAFLTLGEFGKISGSPYSPNKHKYDPDN